ncbi:hypothetical protein ACOMHN_025769 [Nucella lapillus]
MAHFEWRFEKEDLSHPRWHVLNGDLRKRTFLIPPMARFEWRFEKEDLSHPRWHVLNGDLRKRTFLIPDGTF